MAVCIIKQVCDQPPASDVIRTLPVFAAGQIATRIWTNSYHAGRPTYTIQSLLWKGADSSCWGRTQHHGGDSISEGANVYSAGGRLYFVHTFAGGRHYPGILSPRGDFLWGGSITSWWRGTVVERRSLAGELSLSCARPAADGWPLMWVSHPL